MIWTNQREIWNLVPRSASLLLFHGPRTLQTWLTEICCTVKLYIDVSIARNTTLVEWVMNVA